MAKPLLIVGLVFCAAGLVGYGIALANIETGAGETYSDISNACMLVAIFVLVVRLNVRRPPA